MLWSFWALGEWIIISPCALTLQVVTWDAVSIHFTDFFMLDCSTGKMRKSPWIKFLMVDRTYFLPEFSLPSDFFIFLSYSLTLVSFSITRTQRLVTVVLKNSLGQQGRYLKRCPFLPNNLCWKRALEWLHRSMCDGSPPYPNRISPYPFCVA